MTMERTLVILTYSILIDHRFAVENSSGSNMQIQSRTIWQKSTTLHHDQQWWTMDHNCDEPRSVMSHDTPQSPTIKQVQPILVWVILLQNGFFCLKCQALRSCGARSDSHNSILNHNLINSTLWLFNIAMENGPFIAGLPVYLLKIVIFHGYVSHNQRVVPNEPGSIINHVYTPKAWVSIVSPACGLQSFSNGQGSHGSNSSSAPSSPQ